MRSEFVVSDVRARVRVGIITQLGSWSSSTRARALQFVEPLEELGCDVQVLLANDRPERRPGRIGQLRYFAAHAWRYVARFLELRSAVKRLDAVFVQRGAYAMGPGFIVRPLERFDGRVVFDLDDDLFSTTPSMEGKGRLARWLYGPAQAVRLAARADAIVVSTETLAAALPTHRGEVEVLATLPQVSTYEVCVDGGEDGVIGWAGTSGGLRYLDPLAEVFNDLATTHGATLQVVSSAPWNGPSTFVPWRLEDEPSLFARWAIGIMPLPDTDYARSKAGYKLLQYMAAGVACVASPVGVNRQLIEDSGAGFLASTPEQWRVALATLLSDRALRRQMGEAGRAFVANYADPSSHAETINRLIRNVSAL
jgi:glycosyltransferase involved in cell wall biosynthesis